MTFEGHSCNLHKCFNFDNSQAVTQIVKVLISSKQCNIETLLLRTTSRQWRPNE